MSLTISISIGTVADYAALAHWHYATGHPRAITRVLVARCPLIAEPAGVLVITRPPLNGRWRTIAWPGWLDNLSRRDRAHRINADLRCIARIIVDPRLRATGIATALLHTYLSSPQTPRTECLARYGSLVPLLQRAGMTRIHIPPTRAESRLLDALTERGIHPWMLADERTRTRLTHDAPLLHLWRTWAMSSRATRRHTHETSIIDLTWPRLSTTHAAFAFTSWGPGFQPGLRTRSTHAPDAGPEGASPEGLGSRHIRRSPNDSDAAHSAPIRPFAAEPAQARRQ